MFAGTLASGGSHASPADAGAGAPGQLLVSRVVDGDTYELSDGRRVRLIGIDTPEKHSSAKLRRDAVRSGRDARTIRELGERASEYARRLVLGRRVELEFDQANTATGHRDRYGRTLAYVWVLEDGGRQFMVNRRLVAEGYAYAYTRYPFEYADEFLALQRRAYEEGRGLWAEGLGTEAEDQRSSAASPGSGGPAREADKNCSEFRRHAQAQSFFESAGPGDPHRLDGDGDGVACEGLRQRRR